MNQYTVKETKQLMKLLGMPGVSYVDGDNFTSYLVDAINQLVERNIIKPLPVSGNPRRLRCKTIPYTGFVKFDNLTKAQKEIVMHTRWKEFMYNPPSDYSYVFKNIPVDELPATWMEDGLRDPRDGLDVHYKIYKLERSILKHGYNKKRPAFLAIILDQINIGYLDEPPEFIAVLNGGNHRVQAVRNLIRDKKLPRTYKIPTFVQVPSEYVQ